MSKDLYGEYNYTGLASEKVKTLRKDAKKHLKVTLRQYKKQQISRIKEMLKLQKKLLDFSINPADVDAIEKRIVELQTEYKKVQKRLDNFAAAIVQNNPDSRVALKIAKHAGYQTTMGFVEDHPVSIYDAVEDLFGENQKFYIDANGEYVSSAELINLESNYNYQAVKISGKGR